MTESHSTTRFGPLSTYDVTLPDHLTVRSTRDNLLTAFQSFGYDGEQFFGTAFIQGKRLQFTTAMPMSTMLRVSKIDQAPRGSGVEEVMKAANRPKVAGHAKALREYFMDTACKGEKFILPAFAFNFGDESSMEPDDPDAMLLIYANENENSTNGWPALFQLPNAIKLDTTDGGHRGGEIQGILNSTGASPTAQERENLRRNACDVKIIFEKKRVDAHQDFADCAKAKPITGSLISTFDVRDLRNKRAVALVAGMPFLQHYVDATAANVNLSAASLKIWSMSAVRGFVGHIQDRYPPPMGSAEPQVEHTLIQKMDGAEAFFTTLIKHLPQLHTLDLARLEADARKQSVVPPTAPPVRTETPKTFRSKRGGDIALRGIGMSLFARAFVHAKQYGMTYDAVAQKLALVDWHLLDCEKDDLPDTETDEGRLTFADEVRKHLNPIWASVLVVGESRYRIGSSNDEANAAWERIKARYFDATPAQQAAE